MKAPRNPPYHRLRCLEDTQYSETAVERVTDSTPNMWGIGVGSASRAKSPAARYSAFVSSAQ